MSIPKSGNDVALDTNQAIHLLHGVGNVRTWSAQFGTIYVSVPVIGELLFGAKKSSRVGQNEERLEKLLRVCAVLPLTRATADHYAQIRLQLARAGRPIPSNDICIAAASIEHGLPLATGDAHFANITGLQIITR